MLESEEIAELCEVAVMVQAEETQLESAVAVAQGFDHEVLVG